MNLERPFLDETCKIGQGAACCRYLVGTPKGIQCAKLNAGLVAQIEKRQTDAEPMVARGDNCPGLPMD